MLYYNSRNSLESKHYSLSAYNHDYVEAQNQRFFRGDYIDKDLSIFLTLRRGAAPSLTDKHNWGAYYHSSVEMAKQGQYKYARVHGLVSFDTSKSDDVSMVDSLQFQSSERIYDKDLMTSNAKLDIQVSFTKMYQHFYNLYNIDIHQLIITLFDQGDSFCLKQLPVIIKDTSELNTLVDFLVQCYYYNIDNGIVALRKLVALPQEKRK